MYYVVTKKLAAAMQGSTINGNSFKGTCKGIYLTATKAAQYIISNKLQLTYTIVYAK